MEPESFIKIMGLFMFLYVLTVLMWARNVSFLLGQM